MNAFQELTQSTIDNLFSEWKENDDGSDNYPTFGEFAAKSNLLVARSGLTMFLYGALVRYKEDGIAGAVIEEIIASLQD